jgi:hypothetical protein
MDVIRTGRKGRYLNTLEKYHIYKISRKNLHMIHIEAHNPIFLTAQELYDREQYTRYLQGYLSENNHTKSV